MHEEHPAKPVDEVEPVQDATPDTEVEATSPASSGPETEDPDAEGGEGSDAYLVHLDQFEGPLDLLLYLIQRDEMDVYDIPIARITKQYLEYIELLDVFDLDNAGEFLVMASTLMRIKARMLLPVQRPGEDDEDDVDPRDELVRRLLEYKKYKEASQELAKKEQERARFFQRGTEFAFLEEAEEQPPELSLSLFDLLRAVRNVLEEMRGESVHHVYTDVYTVENQESLILERLEREERVRFEELFRGMRVKMEVVVTFVALLDLLKSQRVRALQSSSYGNIWLEAREPDERPDEGADADEAPKATDAAAGESTDGGDEDAT